MFYVYVYFDQTKSSSLHTCGFEPFYVGKGKDDRMTFHITDAQKEKPCSKNKHKINKIRKLLRQNITPHIEIIASNLSEIEAFNLERLIISQYGRYDLNLGPLTNSTDGGDGISGMVFSQEHRKKISDNMRQLITSGKRNNDAWKYSRRGKKETPEETEKRIASRRGSKHSAEARAKISKAKKQFYQDHPEFKNDSMKGKSHSDESKAKMSASLKVALSKPETKELRSKANSGANNPRARPVTIFGVNYDTIGDAFIATGLTRYKMMKEPSFVFL